ncbi:type II CAAX prenyl endopeptidase Rce1 family protein [Streptosporangium longisporum]|uniref:CAAX prenyl protease 2/Lysostaphin resistance protein A-like domain-containing protein n=1 Tax=Streptosporangium longisporum TaxID=46187 RepID=A0ABP6L691_9ACTN
MRDVDMTVTADDGLSLAGTLTLPAGPGPHPAVLLLHGSGRLDRDANTGRLRMELGPPLAAALAKDGIATLRYDRRGVGAGSGDWRATGFTDNRRDAAAALRALAGRPGIRPDAIGLRNLVATIGGPVPFLIGMLIAGPLSEEPGWRGTAYPRLRASLSRLRAGLLLGVVWAVWHLPLFFVPGTVQAGFGLFSWSGLLFTISVVPMALLTGYAYERAGVAASIAVHFGVNATMALLSVTSPLTMASVVAVQIVVAIALLASRRGRDDDPPVDADPRPHRAGRRAGGSL